MDFGNTARSAFHRLPMATRVALRYYGIHHRLPNLRRPRTFTEKIIWRMLRDRSERLAWTCDKLEMKRRMLALDAGITPVPTLWSGTDIEELSGVQLPPRWVLKPNHLTSVVHIGEGPPDIGALRPMCEGWLNDRTLHAESGEWAYGMARPELIVEPWVGGASITDVPDDYKFFVFGGEVKLIQVHKGRGSNYRKYHYLPDWSVAPVQTQRPGSGSVPRPSNLDEMLRQASTIGALFDFMRVDLYNVDGEVLFGETTPYPGGGALRFTPDSYDLELGRAWVLPRAGAASG